MNKAFILFFSLSFALATYSSKAQMVTFGPMVGGNLSMANAKNTATSQTISTDPLVSYTAGAFARVKVLKFYVQPEVMYAHKGVDLKPANTDVQKLRYDVVDVNLMLGMQLFKFFDDAVGFRLHTGPGMTNYIPGSFKVNDNGVNDDNFKTNTFNWQFGLGADVLNRFLVDVRYGLTFSDMVNQGNYKIVPQQVSLLVAYKLIKDK